MEKPEWLTQIETVLEVLNEGVVIADDRHQILFANSRFLEMTGFSRRELFGSDASSFYSPQEWASLTPLEGLAFFLCDPRPASFANCRFSKSQPIFDFVPFVV
jgi:PAS domain-containing protein